MPSEILDKPVVLNDWYVANKDLFSPPVCNKLMHKEQLTIMFVGGPNQRRDFHLDCGSEFFFQIKGNMKLPTIQKGKFKIVDIKEGEVFCLPSCIPHSPQRPMQDSLGLVVERSRYDDELDGLRYFTEFYPDKMDELHGTDVQTILWEKFFYCNDLGRDLVPVVTAFKESDEAKDNVPRNNITESEKIPLTVNTSTEVPDPVPLKSILEKKKGVLENGGSTPLFDEKPDKEFGITLFGKGFQQGKTQFEYESFFHQLEGTCSLTRNGKTIEIPENGCFIVGAGVAYEFTQSGIGMVVTQTPRANEPPASGKRAKTDS